MGHKPTIRLSDENSVYQGLEMQVEIGHKCDTCSDASRLRYSLRDFPTCSGLALRLEVPRGDVATPAQSAAIKSQGQQQWQQRSENDPFEQEMTTAALFTAACWTLWWNLKWKQAMRFWVKPPYRPWVELTFRIFFALNFIGAVVALIRQLHSYPVSDSHILTTVEIAGIMCAVVALMTASTLWMAHRRDTKA